MRVGAGVGPAGRLAISPPPPLNHRRALFRVWCGDWGRQTPPPPGQRWPRGWGDEGKGSGRRELAQSPGCPGSWPDAVNKPSPARHSPVRASSAAPRAVGGGSGEASADSVYKSALEPTQAGCEKHFRSIQFLPLTRCQNIPRRSRPGWGHPEPTGRAAPPPRRADEGRSPRARPIPANSHSSGRRGAPERQRGSAPGDGGAGGPATPKPRTRRGGKAGAADRVFFPEIAGPAAPPPPPDRESGPWRLAACRSGPGSPTRSGLRACG